MNRFLVFIYACAITFGIDGSFALYFNTHFLSQPERVRAALIKEGFIDGFFHTSDQIALHYLWLKRPNARSTVICCSGFWPGRKEGLATLYALLPGDCNIFFFDARGHGISEGTLWRSLFNYGVDEYKDIVGAIEWVHTQANVPIIIFGICAGAFHAMQALLEVHKRELIDEYQLRGMVFDSGWNAVKEVVPTSITGEWRKRAKKIMKCLPKFLRAPGEWAIINPTSSIMQTVSSVLTPLCLSSKAHCCQLLSNVQEITIPLFYIHAEDDTFAAIKPVKKLARKTNCAHTWWITEPSQHACHHLKHTPSYTKRLHDFIDTVV